MKTLKGVSVKPIWFLEKYFQFRNGLGKSREDVILFIISIPEKNESNSYQFFNIVINKVLNFQY